MCPPPLSISACLAYSVGGSQRTEGDLVRDEMMHHGTKRQTIGETLGKVLDPHILNNRDRY